MQISRTHTDAAKAFAVFYATTGVLFGLELSWMGVSDPLFIGYVSATWPFLSEVPKNTTFEHVIMISLGFVVGGIYAHLLKWKRVANSGGEN